MPLAIWCKFPAPSDYRTPVHMSAWRDYSDGARAAIFPGYCDRTVTERDRRGYGRAPEGRCLSGAGCLSRAGAGGGVVADSRVITVQVGDTEVGAGTARGTSRHAAAPQAPAVQQLPVDPESGQRDGRCSSNGRAGAGVPGSGPGRRRRSGGTCFQVAPGVLVIAWHVLEDIGAAAENAGVKVDPLAGGDWFGAVVSRVDPVHDLAVIVSATPLPRQRGRWLRWSDAAAGRGTGDGACGAQ